ncbi:hypothetical protein BKA57DRAFT_393840 [Linnemannia elongata]|nr:hypothetical protein BKA57DRAFT_393840 [Linnemannia elongata]
MKLLLLCRLRFIFSFQTLLDAVTAIPFLLSGFFLPYGQYLYVPYFLRSWNQPFDPVKAKLIGLVAYFIAILYNGVAAFLYCETMFAPQTETPHTVWDALYFILITASTVGYGDITPKSLEARIVVMVFIIVALSIVPGLIAGTIDTLKSSRSGGGSYIQSRSANGVMRQYLVMIGDFQSAKRVADMLSGFFNKEFSDTDVRVVFLSRNKPSKDVKTLLDMPTHKNRTTMLVGNGLDESDLKRCQAKDAGAVFIIPDRTTSGLESQDTMTTLLAWSLHLYAPSTRVFTYNLLPETETFQWGIVEQTMCISDVKQLLLAYSCRHRGTTTLILNLLHPSEPSNSYDDGWQAQYGDGTGNEIYVGPVPDVFVGWTFAQVSGQYHLTLNPGNSYRLGKYDQLVYIAQSPYDVDSINKLTVDQTENILWELLHERSSLPRLESQEQRRFRFRMQGIGQRRHRRVLSRHIDGANEVGTSVTRSETKDLPLCHLLSNPPDSIKPLIKDDLSSLKNHIVICSDAGENLYRFMATLRLAQISREDLKTIVVLTRNPMETFTSETNGNCRHQRDLVRAGILGASSIVIMSHSVEGLDRDEFADSTAIMAHHMIYQTLRQRGLLGRQHIVVDICKFFFPSLCYAAQKKSYISPHLSPLSPPNSRTE